MQKKDSTTAPPKGTTAAPSKGSTAPRTTSGAKATPISHAPATKTTSPAPAPKAASNAPAPAPKPAAHAPAPKAAAHAPPAATKTAAHAPPAAMKTAAHGPTKAASGSKATGHTGEAKATQGKGTTQKAGSTKAEVKEQPHAEEKKVQEAPKTVAPQTLEATEVKLQEIVPALERIWAKNKTPLILDTTGNYYTFLKYKGTILDYETMEINGDARTEKKAEGIESTRKQLYFAMKGATCAFYFAGFRYSLKEYFKNTAWMADMESIFTPSKLKDEKFYKKVILKPEEDVDGFGNKGFFDIKDGFGLVLLLTGQNFDEIYQKMDLPLQCFEALKIVQ